MVIWVCCLGDQDLGGGGGGENDCFRHDFKLFIGTQANCFRHDFKLFICLWH